MLACDGLIVSGAVSPGSVLSHGGVLACAIAARAVDILEQDSVTMLDNAWYVSL